MRLYLKNIGKLKKADIKLEGITVVAGENNSGKSTVGKALYSVYNTFYYFDIQVKLNRDKSLTKLFEIDYPQVAFNFSDTMYDLCGCVEEITQNRENIYKRIFQENNPTLSPQVVEELTQRLIAIDTVFEEDLALQFLKNYIKDEFSMQISNLWMEEKGELSLYTEMEHDTSRAIFTVVDNEITTCQASLDFSSKGIYIDSPFILDESFDERHNNSHRRALKNHLLKSPDNSQALEQILAEKKLKNVLTLLNSVCEGELYFQNTVSYRLGKTGKSLDIKNLSTGLKSFAILKTLLLNGSLSHGSVLILDEPEIHLHPEWQLVYAELIVLLQKEFKLTVLLTTHSPYFLRALEVYAEVHKVSDKCNYYFAKNEGQEAMIYDLTGDIEQIYKKLADPFQMLENLRWQDEP